MKKNIITSLATAVAVVAMVTPAASRAETATEEPDAFLEYIEATGTQYIDTGVNAETGLKARCDFAWASGTISGNDWSLLDAAIDSTSSDKRNRFLMCHLYGGGGKPYFGYGVKQRKNPSGSFAFVGGRRYEIVTDMSDTNSLQLVQNGKNTFSATDLETFKTNGIVNLHLNLYVFACNLSGRASWYAKGKLYEMKIFKKNATTGEFDLLRHYIPCIKDGRAGLYDKANGTISYSDGSAEFNAGPVLDKPLDFVKWIWGNGSQWFDTRVWGRSGIKSEIDISVREYSGDRCILGVRQGNNRIYPAYQYEKQFRYAWGTMPSAGNTTVVHPTNDVSYYMDTRYFIKSDIRDGYQSVLVSKNGGNPTELHKNGVAYNTGAIAITNITLCLLACNNGGTFQYPSKALIYATKIWDGDELLRDFVPVVATNAAGVAYAGLYDRESERVFRQVGTAEFNLTNQVGGVTNTLRTAVVRPQTRLEYIDSDALLDYVDLGVIGKDGVEMKAVMEWLRVPNDGAFVGARHNDSQGPHRFFLYHYWHDNSAGSRHRLGYDGDLFVVGSTSATANTKYRILSRLDVGRGDFSISTFANGAWGAPVTRTILPENGYDGPVDTGLPLYLFAMNLDGTPRYHGKVRLYSLKLNVKQQDGSYAPARDLIPVRDPATGAPVLWDRLTETYFHNSGRYLLAGGGEERDMLLPFMMIIR
jgi:hypothetical protein